MPETTALTVRMTPKTHDVLRYFAYVNKVSLNEIVLQALKKFFLGAADEQFETAVAALRAESAAGKHEKSLEEMLSDI